MKERICIGIPCYAGVPPETLEDYMRFAFHLGRRYTDYEFFLCIKGKSEQFRARNNIVEVALQVAADWLLMMDDDHIIDINESSGDPSKGAEAYDFLKQLLEHDVDIVGPVYYQRGGHGKPVIMDENEQGDPFFISELDLGESIQERAVQGGGCMLIKMKVFDKLGPPWFEPEFTYGTDVQICKKARDAGFKVYNDPTLEIGHVMNDRVVITSRNKNQFSRKDDFFTGTEQELSWKTDNILYKLKTDAAEYLGISERDMDKAFNEGFEKYGWMSLELEKKYGLGTREYYAHMGPAQLQRQVVFHHAAFPKLTMATLLEELKPTKLVGMDFGCGCGVVGFELAKRGKHVYFVDVDGACAYEFLKWRCKKHGLTNVTFGWPEPDSLHYCICLDSIEHLKDWRETLDRIYDSLAVGGNLMTNFMRLRDDSNIEHVFMERPEFMAWVAEKDMLIVSDCVFIKKEPR